MYPSIMISNNICSTTLVRNKENNSESDNISPTLKLDILKYC